MPTEYPHPPAIAAFGDFHIPDGRVWRPDPEWDTRDGGCVAVAHGPAGWVAVADTKSPDTPPLMFNAAEWQQFTQAIQDQRL